MLSRMLPYGGVGTIAKRLGLSVGATSAALRRGNPGHPAVQEAIRMAEISGAIKTAQALAAVKAF